MIQSNPSLLQAGGKWFDDSGKSTINDEATVRAMTIRSSIARKYGAEDPADSIATNPIPGMDFLKARASMSFCHPLPTSLVTAENPPMAAENYFRPVQYPGVQTGKGYSTTYGFNLAINAKAASAKQESRP